MYSARASVCAVAFVAALHAACGSNAPRSTAGDPLVLRIGTFAGGNEPGSIPYILSAEALVTVGWNGRLVYRLAESAAEAPDALTFKLRPNLTFHNGEPVTADHVRRLFEAKPSLMESVGRIDVEGDDVLILRLQRPHALRLADLSDYTVHDENRPELRTGPFRIVSQGTPATLERFERYHAGTPSVARVEIHRYPTHRAAWTAMMRGEINVLPEVSPDAIDFIQAGGANQAYPLLRPYYVSLVFNLKHEILKRREVRFAVTEAIDRREIVETGLRGHGEIAEGPFWPNHWAYPHGHRMAPYNPEAARVRLEAARLPVRDPPSAAMPARFAFTCLLPEGDMRFERIAMVVQRQLFAIGVDMQIEPVTSRDLLQRLRTGDFDAFLLDTISGRGLNWVNRLWHSPAPGASPPLSTGYASADAALDRLRLAATDEQVRIAVADVMRVLREDPPAAFLVWRREARAVEQSIHVPYEPQHDIFGTLWQSTRVRATADASR